jgi:hypothetical protein
MKNLKHTSLLFVIGLFLQANAFGQELSRAQTFQEITSSSGQMSSNLLNGNVSRQDFTNFVNNTANELYMKGYVSLAQRNSKPPQVTECYRLIDYVAQPRDWGGHANYVAHIAQRNAACNLAANFVPLRDNPPACLNQINQRLAGTECCAGYEEGPSHTLDTNLGGLKVNEACTSHEACASKRCEMSESGTGVCAMAMACYRLLNVGEECDPSNPRCKDGICLERNQGQAGVTCKFKDATCSNNNECCSEKCGQGKCAEKYVCDKCTREGLTPTSNEPCCRGLIKDLDGKCMLEMPPFILPKTFSSTLKSIFKQVVSNLFIGNAFAIQSVGFEVEGPGGNSGGVGGGPVGGTVTGGTSGGSSTGGASGGSATAGGSAGATGGNSSGAQGPMANDNALTPGQLDTIEEAMRAALAISNLDDRKAAMLAAYELRKGMIAANAQAAANGNPVNNVMTQEQYIQRYNAVSITPKTKSNIEQCIFNSAKDNWIDSTNMMRNAELFMRAFEVSYSGHAFQDYWNLINESGAQNPDNIYKRTKAVMSEIRDNRLFQRDQLQYLDLLMTCQCIYSFGLDKFDAEKQAFFLMSCNGSPDNKICRKDEMQDDLMLPDSTNPAFREGKEFPDYVSMYFADMAQMENQATANGTVNTVESGAVGVGHEEVLVRWLRLRTCNQVDVFMDAEKVETELQSLMADLSRAKKENPRMKTYWQNRLQQMASNGVDSKIISMYANDPYKTTYLRGYYHSESKVNDYMKKSPRLLLALVLFLLGGFLLVFIYDVFTGGSILATLLGITFNGGLMTFDNSYDVLKTFSKNAPNVVIEDRLIKKENCGFLDLFHCKTFFRILHWPYYTSIPGQEYHPQLAWKKETENSCEMTYSTVYSLGAGKPNACVGMFKATNCARGFYRMSNDSSISSEQQFAPWKTFMKDRMMMDPVFPDLIADWPKQDNTSWTDNLNNGFYKGCQWVNTIGKKAPQASDKFRFFPDLSKIINPANGTFKDPYKFTQERIDQYKDAVKKYALCKDLAECGSKYYDGKHPKPSGFNDIIEDDETASLFANYVFQTHFMWRHMSGEAGIGYPLAFLENYYNLLVYNNRLLTTLSIRRGLELDDAYNLYGDDLTVRRSNYGLGGSQYSVKTGDDKRDKAGLRSRLYNSFRSLGFPLSADFSGLGSASSLKEGSLKSDGAASGNLGAFESKVLGAASRHAGRVANDNKNWKNYESQIKGKKDSEDRLERAKGFFGSMNNAVGGIGSLANPNDTSSYNGIGGEVSNSRSRVGSRDEEKKTEQKYGAVPSNQQAADDFGGSGSFGGSDFGGSGFGGGTSSSTDDESDLLAASKLTGMKEGDLQTMLDAADKERNKKLSSNPNDTLFGQISKAYHRNLDRVLVRKKSAASIEGKAVPKKGAEKGGGEKQAIKDIFKKTEVVK